MHRDDARRRDPAAIAARIVGRERELDLVLAAIAAGRDIVLEGPPGTWKTTLLRAITAEWGIPLVFVEGNADLTPAKLVGHHNPARVLREDYSAENFVDGPLLEAMRTRRLPLHRGVQPRARGHAQHAAHRDGRTRGRGAARRARSTAVPSFRVVASMNPFDNVGTTRLSTSVHDRLCRLAIGYQDEAAERGIVALRAAAVRIARVRRPEPDLMADAVAVTRATREHPDLRQGSSVRGAIDLSLWRPNCWRCAASTTRGEGRPATDDGPAPPLRRHVFDAMVVALSGRIHLDETAETTPRRCCARSGRTTSCSGRRPPTPG